MALFAPRQLPIKVVLLLALFSLLVLNAGGWYLYNLALTALDERMAAQLWSIGRTAALDVEASGLPEIMDLLHEAWPEVRAAAESGEDVPELEAAFLATLGDVAAYLGEVSRRNGLKRLVLTDPRGRVLTGSAGRTGFGETDLYFPLDRIEVAAAGSGREAATVTYPVEGVYYKRAYVPIRRYQGDDSAVVLILGLEAGAGEFREMEALRRQLWALALVSAGVGALLMLLVYRTIRRNLALERSSERARRAFELGQMTATVAHQIRNPLGIIQTNAECLRSLLDDPAARGAADDILAETDRLAAIVRRFAGLSGSPAPADPSPPPAAGTDLRRLLENLVLRSSDRARGKGIDLRLEIPATGAADFRVAAPEDALDSAFQNLIDNAMESIAGEGAVTVRLRREARTVEVEVGDTGDGMTAEELEAALEPFHSTKEHGMGIGLPLAKTLLEKAGGRLTLRSRRGKGTRAKVELPAS